MKSCMIPDPVGIVMSSITNWQVLEALGGGLLPNGKETIVSISLDPSAMEIVASAPGLGVRMVAGAGFVIIQRSSAGIVTAWRLRGVADTSAEARARNVAAVKMPFMMFNACEDKEVEVS